MCIHFPYGVRSVRVDGIKFLINEKPFTLKVTESTKIHFLMAVE